MHLLSLVPPTAPGVSASRPFWMSTVAGEKIFLYSRERVFTEVPVANISVPGSTSSDGVDESDAALASLTGFIPESYSFFLILPFLKPYLR